MPVTTFLATNRASRMAAHAPALVVEGRFNRSAIMRRAVRFARDLYRPGGSWTWTRCMQEGLRFAWTTAKTEKADAERAAALFARPARDWTPAPRRPAARVPFTYDRGFARTNHGW